MNEHETSNLIRETIRFAEGLKRGSIEWDGILAEARKLDSGKAESCSAIRESLEKIAFVDDSAFKLLQRLNSLDAEAEMPGRSTDEEVSETPAIRTLELGCLGDIWPGLDTEQDFGGGSSI